MTTLDRTGARVLLLDPADRVLLFRGHDPVDPAAGSYWFTVGGGLEPGESAVDGACRETFEETGVRLDPAALVGPLWHESAQFPFNGLTICQEQDYYLARCPGSAVDTSRQDAIELQCIEQYRWWSVAELDQTAETVYPADLAQRLRGLLDEAPR